MKSLIVISNYFFGIVFTLEAMFKLAGFGIVPYFNNGWNVFDFIIVIAAWVGFILKVVLGIRLGSIAYIIRLFRLGRVLRLIKKSKNIKKSTRNFVICITSII